MTHPTAILEGNITLADDVEIGAYATLRGNITLASGVRIAPHACLEGEIHIGERTAIGHHAVIGGDPQDLKFDPATASSVHIGTDNVLRELTTVHRGSKAGNSTRIGNHNYLMAGSHLGHDVSLGNHNILANNVLLGGFVSVADHVFLGGGSVYHQNIRIGSHCMVQGISGFSKDIPPYVLACRTNELAGLNTIGLRRAGIKPEARASLKRAYHLVVRQGAKMADIQAALSQSDWSPEARHYLEFHLVDARHGILRS